MIRIKDQRVTLSRWEGAYDLSSKWELWPKRAWRVDFPGVATDREVSSYTNGAHAIFETPIPIDLVEGATSSFFPNGLSRPSEFMKPIAARTRTRGILYAHYAPMDPTRIGKFFVPLDSFRMVDAYLGTSWGLKHIYGSIDASGFLKMAGIIVSRGGNDYLAGIVTGYQYSSQMETPSLITPPERIDMERPRWRPKGFVSPIPEEFIRDTLPSKPLTKKTLRVIDAYIANGLLIEDE